MKKGFPQYYIQAGEQFSGYQKSLSKKSEYFFSELEIQITDINHEEGLISGVIDKKIISITGKKRNKKIFFEGEIIDGINNTFTSSLTAGNEMLDVYFWNRFPSFKDISSLRELKQHSSKFVYMRWHEKGTLKQRTKVKTNSKTIKDQKNKTSEKQRLNPEEESEEEFDFNANPEESEEEEFEEYFDSTADEEDEELNANGNYFICYDMLQNKITGYFKQAFLKNCQKLILEQKTLADFGNSFPICEKL